MPWMGIYEDGCFCILDDTIQEQFGYEREDGPAPRPLFSPCLSVARTWHWTLWFLRLSSIQNRAS